jgi:hypothetical protein
VYLKLVEDADTGHNLELMKFDIIFKRLCEIRRLKRWNLNAIKLVE